MVTKLSKSEKHSQHTEEIANNMALMYADKISKRASTIADVPEAIRPAVEALLARR